MTTLVEVGQVLENARGEAPLSLAEIERCMSARRTRHATIRASVDFLERLGFVTIGSKGIQWTYTRNERLLEAVREGRLLLEKA